ncbi:MAG: tyrosine-type recombinase/integrase [Polyangia bacterium]
MQTEPKIFGPYPHRDGFRCFLGEGTKRTALPTAETREAARRFAEATLRQLIAATPVSIETVLERYQEHLALSCRPASITTALFRLKSLLPGLSSNLQALTPAKCQAQYLALAKRQKADTHRNALATAKTFGRWLVEQKLIRQSPFEAIKPVGTRSRGKEQLTHDETKRWSDEALRQAAAGKDGALAAYMALLLGLRPGEIVVRTVRDVDDGGTMLRIRHAKTRAGDRDIVIPEVLRPLLAARCRGKAPDGLLFESHFDDGEPTPYKVPWVRDNVRRICKRIGVPMVCAHSMRGKHSDLAVRAGVTPDVVAESVGHTSARVTMGHYAKPESLHAVQRERAAQRLGLSDPEPRLRLVR